MARSKKLQAVSDDTKTENIGGTKLDLKELEKAGFTMLENSTYAKVDNRLPTGLPLVDLTMGGGIPFHRTTQVFSANGIGKSNFAIQVMKSAQSMGVRVILIDVEGTAEPERLARMGLDVSSILIKESSKADPEGLSIESIGETLESAIEILTKHNDPILFVWDSVGQSISRKTMNADFDNEQPGVQAKAITKVIQKISPKLSATNSALLILNQLRDKIATGFAVGPTVTFPGGRALEHALSLNYQLGKAGDLKSGQEYMGHKVKFSNKKSKVSKPFQKAEQFLFGDAGMNDMVNIIYTGEQLGFVKVSTAGGRKVEVPNEETGEIEKFPYFEFLEHISTQEGADEFMYFLKPTFQKIIKHAFPEDFPPLHNKDIDVTLNPLYQGLEELYKPEPVEEPREEETVPTEE